MNLQQFRFLREAARHKFNITSAARALHTSQPGVSKAIIELEGELGVSILARQGKRILGLTPPGQQVLLAAERIMQEVDNLKKLSRDFAGSPSGTLRVATTHTQARYVLPKVVAQFVQKFPQVRLKLLEADPPNIAAMLSSGQADIGFATETLAETPGLRSIPVYDWQHVAIVPPGHPLAKLQLTPGKLTLKELARHPIVTYEAHFAGRAKIDAAFAEVSIEPSIVLEAIDADVIKTYVQVGLGVGIIAGVAADIQRDGLAVLPCGHLFGKNTARLAVKHGAYLRGFVYAFIELLAPGWDKRRLEEAFAE
ncbi:MAG TPA: CysB family HTH-type transcriptional regulator [Burkholderiaceae bacterium]|nr:CysB family HTH-type transcriptional regulator [Burkholderiaceae bacterium]